MRILYLEDDQMQQVALSAIAESLGHEIVCDSNMLDFKARIQTESFDLILMDNLLENNENSFDEIEWVREIVGNSVGIIGLTGASTFMELTKVYKDLSLMNHLICKPISSDNLASALYFVGGELGPNE